MNAQCNQTTNLSCTTVSQSCPAGNVTYNLVYSSSVSSGNNSICYGYTITSPGGSQQTTNIGPVNQSNSLNTNWSHSFNVTISCTQSLTMFINAFSNQNCGGNQCASPRSQTLFLSPLPVELINFKGFANESGVALQWQTAKEINNRGFSILHSENGFDFEEVGFIEGKGFSDAIQSYTFSHDVVLSSNHYYQLRQEDFDGMDHFSPIIKINTGKDQERSQYFINDGRLMITSPTDTRIQIFDAMGGLIESRNIESGESTVSVEHWRSGVYFIHDGINRPVSVYNP